MLDNEWPQIKATFESWLDQSNFDESGKQIKSLIQIRTERAAEK